MLTSFVFIVGCLPLLANELSLSVSTGYVNGALRELVYRTPPRLLSELQWKIGDVLRTQVQFSGKIEDAFWFSLSLGLPLLLTPGVDAEQMIDRDWLYHTVGRESSEASNTSWHRVKQEPSVQWSGGIGLDLFPKEDMDLILGAGLSYIFWSWEDLSDKYDYRVDNSQLVEDSGTREKQAIFYQSSLWFLELLLRWRSPQWGRFRLDAEVRYSPYTVWLGYDSHLLRDTLFRDSGDFGQSLKVSVEGEWRFSRELGAFLGGELVNMFESQGYGDDFKLLDDESISEAISKPPTNVNNDVGMSYFSYSFYVGVRLFFDSRTVD